MDLEKEFDRHIATVHKLQHFIELYTSKIELIADLQKLNCKTNKVSGLLQKCNDMVKQFEGNKKQQFEQLTKRARDMQNTMLIIMDKLNEKEQLEKQQQQQQQEQQQQQKHQVFNLGNMKENLPHKYNGDNVLNEKRNNMLPADTPLKNIFNVDTPCRLADYMKSPFTLKKMRPISLQFVDFVYKIPYDEFMKIPQYMRGRETIEDIQSFLDDVIVQCFTSKYALLPKRKEAVSTMEIELWNLYRRQESYFKAKFITQGDICHLINKQIDRKMNNRLTILRHLKILIEERKNSAICYIWNK